MEGPRSDLFKEDSGNLCTNFVAVDSRMSISKPIKIKWSPVFLGLGLGQIQNLEVGEKNPQNLWSGEEGI